MFVLVGTLLYPAQNETLYKRLGGYDAIASIATDFHIRLKNDPQLGRFWAYRGTDGMDRELQLLIDFMCEHTGGSTHYAGRDMGLSHRGMNISGSDWKIFMRYLKVTLDEHKVKVTEQKEVIDFVESLKSAIVERK